MLKQALAIAVLLCTAAGGVQAKEVKTRNIPVPQTVSPELQKLIGAKDPGWWNTHPKTTKEWKKWVAGLAAQTAAIIPPLREKLGVTSEEGTMAGVKIYTLTPRRPSRIRIRIAFS